MGAIVLLFLSLGLLLQQISSFRKLPLQRRSSILLPLRDNQIAHDQEQWRLFEENCKGFWKGLQAGYDPQDDEVEDYMYTEVTVEGTEDDESLTQKNGFVVGEIRADCEVCYDSERLRIKDAGVFREGAMGNRKCCGNVDVRGPSPTVRGMSVETGFRHGDGRVRVLLSYSPIDFDENQIPLAMGLMDVVITRERLNKRPLKLDEGEGGWDDLWRDTTEADFEKLTQPGEVLSNEARQYLPDDELRVLPSPPLQLESLEAISISQHLLADTADKNKNQDEEEDQFVYRRAFPGGILVEAQAIVYPGSPTRIRLAHAPSSAENVVFSADLSFAALEPPSQEQIERTGEVRLNPPRLLDFIAGNRETKTRF